MPRARGRRPAMSRSWTVQVPMCLKRQARPCDGCEGNAGCLGFSPGRGCRRTPSRRRDQRGSCDDHAHVRVPGTGRPRGVCGGSGAGGGPGTGGRDGAPPNIVVIMADDLGYGDIGPYDGWIDTPRLDRMARDGMRFLDFHSSGNVCSPTRAGLMTGRYQQRAGIPGVLFANPARSSHDDGIEAGELTLAEALRARGYATGIFGKWHLGYRARFNPVRHGFDEFRGFVSGNIDYRSHVDTMGRADWWRDDELSTEAGYATHLVTEYALRFIERHRDRPFFLYLPHHAPHYPFQGPDDPADRAVGGEFDPRGSVADRRRAYRDMVREMDAGVGEVLDALEAHGIADRTLVWFFSDNGAAQWGSNGPLRGLKATDWEGGHRLPSIAVWPARIPAGTESNQLVSALDGVDLSPVLLR